MNKLSDEISLTCCGQMANKKDLIAKALAQEKEIKQLQLANSKLLKTLNIIRDRTIL